MNIFEELFSVLAGGRILDAATGEGGFIRVLHKYLNSYTEIIGIDSSGPMINTAQRKNKNNKVHFVQMNAGQIGFEEASFDTVSIAVSLHHLENVRQVLGEMKRVLKPGGRFIICEMHRDGMTEAQFNAIRIHHWAAEVDASLGTLHDRTFARAEILDYIDGLNLNDVNTRDIQEKDADPLSDKAVTSVGGYIDKYVQRAGQISTGEILIQRGEELRRSLHEKGVQREPVLVVIGQKP
ncbi:class I SAM-dependent methyltransferase [Chloroflexota bacterium]